MSFNNQQLSTSSALNSASFANTTANVLVAGLAGMGVGSLTQRIGVVLHSRFERVFTKECRGFAQRRASVTSAIRAGYGVCSSELVTGADLLLALETVEALRHEQMIAPGALVIVCDICVTPSGYAGREFRPIDVAQVSTRLSLRGARVLGLPVRAWLTEHSLPLVYASSAVLGAFVALYGMDLAGLEGMLCDSWPEQDLEGNLSACRWAHAHVHSLTRLNQVAEAV